MCGVGAAFDFHAGLVAQAPPWMQRRGLEWLYRLTREPRRLRARYLRYNPRFVARALRRWSARAGRAAAGRGGGVSVAAGPPTGARPRRRGRSAWAASACRSRCRFADRGLSVIGVEREPDVLDSVAPGACPSTRPARRRCSTGWRRPAV